MALMPNDQMSTFLVFPVHHLPLGEKNQNGGQILISVRAYKDLLFLPESSCRRI
jgi:hypothetical protein